MGLISLQRYVWNSYIDYQMHKKSMNGLTKVKSTFEVYFLRLCRVKTYHLSGALFRYYSNF